MLLIAINTSAILNKEEAGNSLDTRHYLLKKWGASRVISLLLKLKKKVFSVVKK